MKHMGVRGIVPKLLQSYLDKRLQYVKFNQEKSVQFEIKCGIPCGPILGFPLLILHNENNNNNNDI